MIVKVGVQWVRLQIELRLITYDSKCWCPVIVRFTKESRLATNDGKGWCPVMVRLQIELRSGGGWCER